MESNKINEAFRLHLFCNAGNISFFGMKFYIFYTLNSIRENSSNSKFFIPTNLLLTFSVTQPNHYLSSRQQVMAQSYSHTNMFSTFSIHKLYQYNTLEGY